MVNLSLNFLVESADFFNNIQITKSYQNYCLIFFKEKRIINVKYDTHLGKLQTAKNKGCTNQVK